jgi:mono/diheme cytochrome c family protein
MREPTKVAGAVLAALAIAGCAEGEKHSRGWDYLPDMYDSPAYRSYQAEVVGVRVVEKGEKGERIERTETHHVPMMLPPVEGTISRDFVPYSIALTDLDAARKNPNPIAPTAAVLRVGQANFNVFCAVCHGNDGNAANGYVAKQFSGVMSLNSTNVAAMPEGEIYHIATLGRGRMPNYRAQLLPETRWAVVLYVKALARASVAVGDADAAVKNAQADVDKDPKSEPFKLALARAQQAAAAAKTDKDLLVRGQAGADAFEPKPAAVPEYVKPEWPEH